MNNGLVRPINDVTVKWAAQTKKVLRTCAKCTDSDSFRACMKSHPGVSSPLVHSIASNDSVSGQRNS